MPLPRALKAGDTVEIVATRTMATVLETPKPGEKVKVQAGILKIQVQPSELQLMEGSAPKKQEKLKATNSVRLAAPSTVSTEIDLRGQNGDEAVMDLERFIDNAVRLHLESIRIIHGKGTGVLRQRVQACLKKHSQVKSFRLGIYGEGEDGVTIATLRK
jgi:DNA mismatch repair protein MutS2